MRKQFNKESKLDMNEHKAMIITDVIFQTNKKLFAVVNPKNACKFEFADHLWLPFLDQPLSDVLVFAKKNHIYI